MTLNGGSGIQGTDSQNFIAFPYIDASYSSLCRKGIELFDHFK